MRLLPLMASTDEVHDCGGPVEPAVLSGVCRMPPVLGRNVDLEERAVWLAALDELLSLAEGLLAETRRRHLAAARARVAEDRFNLVVLGEFKRGKSTLINALLSRNVLAHRRRPADIGRDHHRRWRGRSAACLLRGRPRGGAPTRRAGRIRDRGAEPGQPSGRRAGDESSSTTTCCASASSLSTPPGIGSIHSHNTEAARALSSLGSTRRSACSTPGSRCPKPSVNCCSTSRRTGPRLLLVINKIDHLDAPTGPGGGRTSSARRLRDLLGQMPRLELFAVSARQGEGLDPLLARLRNWRPTSVETLRLRSVARLAAKRSQRRSRRQRASSRARSSSRSISSARAPRPSSSGSPSCERQARRPGTCSTEGSSARSSSRSTSRSSCMRGARRPACGRTFASTPAT